MFPSASKRCRQHLLTVPTAFEFRRGGVAHPLSRQEGDSECPAVEVPRFRFCSGRGSTAACAASPRAAAAIEEATHTSRAAPRPGTAVVVKISARPGLRSGEPSGFRSDAWVCKFQAANHSVNARVVSSRDFGSAAGFRVFQLWVQEGTATGALSARHPDSVAESF